MGLHDADDLGRAALQAGLAGALVNAEFVLIPGHFAGARFIDAVGERRSVALYGP